MLPFEDADERRLKHKNEMADGSAGFDAVIGNPPYVRVELLDRVTKQYLKWRYTSIVDRCDIYVGFIESSLLRISKGGQTGFITSNQFFNTDYGKAIRGFLAKRQAIRRLVDLSPLQVFDEALTYPAILVCSAIPQPNILVLPMELVATEFPTNLRHDAVFAAHSRESTEVPAERIYGAEVWNALTACSGPLELDASDQRFVRLGAVFNVTSTMTSGDDAVLVGRIVEEGDNHFKIICHTTTEPITVAKEVWRRVIRPSDINDDGTTATPTKAVFWPYRAVSVDQFQLISEPDLIAICKTTHDHLARHRESLESRRDSGKTWKEHGRPWYALLRVGSPRDYDPPKLVSPGEFTMPRFSLSMDNSVIPHARVIGISCITVPIPGLQAFVHSSYAARWFRCNLPPKGGGFRGMSVGNLSKLPIPRTTDLIWQELAEAAGQQAAEEVIANWLAKA
jgi:hypothetical protein